MPYTSKQRENHRKLMANLNAERRTRRRTQVRTNNTLQVKKGIRNILMRHKQTRPNAHARLEAELKEKVELKKTKTMSPKKSIQPIEKNSIVGSIIPSDNINLPIINTGIVTLPNKGNRSRSINKGNRSRSINKGNKLPNTKKICTDIGCFPKSLFPSFFKFKKRK